MKGSNSQEFKCPAALRSRLVNSYTRDSPIGQEPRPSTASFLQDPAHLGCVRLNGRSTRIGARYSRHGGKSTVQMRPLLEQEVLAGVSHRTLKIPRSSTEKRVIRAASCSRGRSSDTNRRRRLCNFSNTYFCLAKVSSVMYCVYLSRHSLLICPLRRVYPIVRQASITRFMHMV